MVESAQDFNRILLVEGQDDKHVISSICRKNPASFSVEQLDYTISVNLIGRGTGFLISEKGNFTQVRDAIDTEIRGSGREAVGILVDADSDLEKRWNEVREAFPDFIQVPSSPQPDGTIIETEEWPRTGIWVMPNNADVGELEDFVLQMIPTNDSVWPSSQSYIDNISMPDRKFSPEKTDKAKLYAWLATRREPSRMGAAINANDLETNGPLCQSFVSWLTRLFG